MAEDDINRDPRRASELTFDALVKHVQDFAVFMLDPHGHVITWNDGGEHIKGYKPKEIIGKHFSCFYTTEDINANKPEQELKTAMAEGWVEDQSWRVRKDGSRFWATISITALRDGAGNLRGFLKIVRDSTAEKEGEEEVNKALVGSEMRVEKRTAALATEIMERRRAEDEAGRRQAWLRSLIAATQDAVVSIDRRGCIVLFNPAAQKIFGYTADEIVGQKVNELMAEPYASEHDGYIERYERTGEAHAIGRIRSVMAKRKNGEPFPIELSVTEIEGDQDVHYAAFIRDISEKSELQTRLVENERLAAIGMTAAKIGHELANPLNGMSLTVQLLEQRLARQLNPPDNQVVATVKRLKDEISRLNFLAGEFRTISRKEKYHFRPTSLARIIEDIINLQATQLAARAIEIKNLLPHNLPRINADADKMKQALLNLMKNAAEAMPGGGKITIEAFSTDEAVVLEIADTGTGIPLDVDAFEPFATTKKGGTGLGLIIVRQIVVAHSGTISYRSQPGEGTTFRIVLPLK